MRSYGYDCNLIFAGAAEPENPVCGGRPVFCRGFEHLFAAWAAERFVPVSVQTRMAPVGF